MKHLLRLSLCLFPFFVHTHKPLPLSEVAGEPSAIVAGCVNAISGSYSESHADLILQGAEPLEFHRRYNSRNGYQGNLNDSWDDNYEEHCFLHQENKWAAVSVPDKYGVTPVFIGDQQLKHWREFPRSVCTFKLDRRDLETGLTNCTGEGISGKSNYKNYFVQFIPGGTLNVTRGDGTLRVFTAENSKQSDVTIPFYLRYERRPNGNKIHYERQSGKLRITAFDATEKKTLNWIEKAVSGPYLTINSSEGQWASYQFGHFFQPYLDHNGDPVHRDGWHEGETLSLLTGVTRSGAPPQQYGYELLYNFGFKVTESSYPEKRYRRIDYYHPHRNCNERGCKFGDGLLGKVATLSAPVGCNEQPVVTHRFFYSVVRDKYCALVKGTTEVRDAYNHPIAYIYNGDEKLEIIERFDEAIRHYSMERFYWGDPQSIYRSDLVAKALLDASGRARSCRTLDYDERHNVIAETLYGNLSGEGPVFLELDALGRPKGSSESYTTRYTYSQEGYNLLLSESEENGKRVEYSYLPQTDLLIAKRTLVHGQIVQREFHEYNGDAVRVRTVKDNGTGFDCADLTGVTTRCMTLVTPKENAPGIGLPVCVEERYLDLSSGEEKLLERQINHYDGEARLEKRELYNSLGEQYAVLSWEYDGLGNVTREVNVLGQETRRRFDANGNLLFQQGPRPDVQFHCAYDFSNRCIKRECVQGQERKVMTYSYDFLGQKVGQVDEFGHNTRYFYDPLGRLIKTQSPSVMGPGGVIASSETRYEYDIAGNVIATIDAHCNRTQKEYTIRGKVAAIHHPDGGVERFIYNCDGSLQTSIATNGLTTRYTYDPLGNLICKECLSHEGERLSLTTARYQGSQLIAQVDPSGEETLYEYDGAGRLIASSHGVQRTEWEYDAFGRRFLTREWSDEARTQARVTRLEYDLGGRVLVEQIEDLQGHVLQWVSYTYDEAGNKTATSRQTPEGLSRTAVVYDLKNRPIRLTDPFGHTTVIEYLTSYNTLGHQVLEIRTTDPLGHQTQLLHDVLGRKVSEKKLSLWGDLLAHTTYVYDWNHNLVEQIETIWDGPHERKVVTCWQYDSRNRPSVLREAVGDILERATRYSYNTQGEQEAVQLPDGGSLLFAYDPFGRLVDYRSSDASIQYHYAYDLNGNLTAVYDAIQEATTTRCYDKYNRLSSETLASGLTLSYAYDPLGRPIQAVLPDGSSVEYTYDALHLRTAARRAADRSLEYAHHYEAYNLQQQVTSETLIGLSGKCSRSYDALSRPYKVETSYTTESIPSEGYDPAGNLVKRHLTDPRGEEERLYHYNPLNQLVHETGVAEWAYCYDSLGNRLQKNEERYRVNALNQLTQAGDVFYEYDKRGHLIADGERTYSYDILGRLVGVKSPNHHVSYEYDSCNRRLKKRDLLTGKTVRYLYFGLNEVGAVDDNNHMVEFRLLGKGKGAEIGAAVAIELEGKLYAPLHDISGNVTRLIDARTGAVAESYDYSAFGEEQIFDARGERLETSSNPWRFSSKRVDEETGFVYFGHRYYDPVRGRFITPDPLGYRAGPNLYAFVRNNPLTHFDLYGLKESTDQKEASVSAPKRSILDAVRWLVTIPARIGEALTWHLVPVPVVREALCGTFRLLQGRPFNGCDRCHAVPSYNDQINGLQLAPDRRLTATNGILNLWWQAEEFFNFVWDTHGNNAVNYTYGSSRGFVIDIAESIALFFGIATRAVYAQAANWKARFQEMKEAGYPEGRISHLAFSQGGQITWVARKLMEKEELRKIDIITLGSAEIIPQSVFGDAENWISKWDPIPFLGNPVDYWRARIFGMPNVHFLESKGSYPFCDHAVRGETYAEVIKNSGQLFQKKLLNGAL